jgi:hypothetical protein
MPTDYPQVQPKDRQERLGIQAVGMLITQMDCVWRETSNTDVGIDGHIELVEQPGHTRGRLVAAQVKSGPSYFQKSDTNGFLFYPSEKHRNYWMAYPIPVMLILYNPESQVAFWADVRQQLRSPLSSPTRALHVPTSQKLIPESRAAFFHTTGPVDEEYLDEVAIVQLMSQRRSGEFLFDLSLLELFFLGLTDTGRKLFFSMGLCTEVAEYRSYKKGTGGVSIGAYAHEFIDRYIVFLFSQGLVYLDYCDYLIDRDELGTQPVLLMPLSPRGIRVRDEIYSRLELFGIQAARREFLISVTEDFVDSIPDHLECLDELSNSLRKNPVPENQSDQ